MKKNYLFSLILLFIGLIFSPTIYAQKGTYKIVKTNNVDNVSEYAFAMDKANFDAYRYINRRRKITFDTGVEIELLSVYELQKLNIPVDASKGRIYNNKIESSPIYRLSKNGYILAEVKTINNFKEK